ncbi:MAG: HupE/UreJ family protein [Alphaproteobacteria bacterium]|nr:HupE/UreJ family protein [Alphaproteobacteria bacterium]
MYLARILLLCFFCLPFYVHAHEVKPAVADLFFTDKQVELKITMQLEVVLAGIDASQYQDTNLAPQADQYDRYRQMSPSFLAQKFKENWQAIASQIRLLADNRLQDVGLVDVKVADVSNRELPRDGVFTLRATVPQETKSVTFGWDQSFGSLVLRQQIEGSDRGFTGLLQPGVMSEPITRSGSPEKPFGDVFVEYIPVGIEHIVPLGLDHIIFVVGLFFYAAGIWTLIKQVSIFTLAHTCTLALATLGFVSVPAAVVEPLIAASIAYIAVENIVQMGSRKLRYFVIFCFGLLHGLGFASVLGEFGLPGDQMLAGLLGFNVGVELGQLIVLLPFVLVLGIWPVRQAWYRGVVQIPVSASIGCIGLYWALDRSGFMPESVATFIDSSLFTIGNL